MFFEDRPQSWDTAVGDPIGQQVAEVLRVRHHPKVTELDAYRDVVPRQEAPLPKAKPQRDALVNDDEAPWECQPCEDPQRHQEQADRKRTRIRDRGTETNDDHQPREKSQRETLPNES